MLEEGESFAAGSWKWCDPIVHNARTAEASLLHAADMAEEFAKAMRRKASDAEALLRVQKAALGEAFIPLSGLMRDHVLEARGYVETMGIFLAGGCGSIWLPNVIGILLTHRTRPTARTASEKLLLNLENLLPKLLKEEELDEDEIDALDDSYAGVVAELRNTGTVAAMSKQVRSAKVMGFSLSPMVFCSFLTFFLLFSFFCRCAAS